jgi:hypothetical protein
VARAEAAREWLRPYNEVTPEPTQGPAVAWTLSPTCPA